MKHSLLSIAFILFAAFGLSAQNLSDYPGTFNLEDNPYVKKVKVELRDAKLMVIAEGFPDSELTAGKAVDQFAIGSGDLSIEFSRANGKVVGCKIMGSGQEIKGVLAIENGLSSFAGTFKMIENEYVKNLVISYAEGQLYLTSDANDGQKSLLSSTKDVGSFTTNVRGYDAEVTFTKANDAVKSIKLSVAGGAVVLTGERI
ncbi:hypothetical protein EOJ36_03660 [Sandaracinomonas limnophila]|uniref:Auto-transporter adhesin head GIN domain-containing protein n=1 Tax=Sandaracinomonas limnophila TaxID=1862386 RepID=A0A437PTC8_9BACT|nr:hypothetical protein [Sandaracinomonas limnophila]RVU25525.1 hypothetical protein EOJ36_03660 [Sandaracinomonas limnophila]